MAKSATIRLSTSKRVRICISASSQDSPVLACSKKGQMDKEEGQSDNSRIALPSGGCMPRQRPVERKFNEKTGKI